MKLETSDADIVKALKHCRDTYLTIPSSTQLVVTMGRYAMFSLTGIQNEESEYGKKQGVMETWRGYAVDMPSYADWRTVDTRVYHPLHSHTRIMFTQHIAALFRGTNKRFFHATLQDFHKIRRLLVKQWPVDLPTWSDVPPAHWPSYAAFDTEYVPDENYLIRWSLCDAQNMELYCVEADSDVHSSIIVQPNSTVLIQNALADINYLVQLIDTTSVSIEDMMLAHSVLWTGEPHNLNYIASKYGAFNRYKHLSAENPQLYSALDAYEPMYMWKSHFLPEFRKDSASWNIYKKYRLPLINIINKAQQTGAKVDTNRLTEIQHILREHLQHYKERAVELTGDSTFNLGGQKGMRTALYG